MLWILRQSNWIGLAFLLGGIALLIRSERRRNDALYGPIRVAGENAPDSATFDKASASILPHAPGGDTLTATATVRDPTTAEILDRSLYTGQMIADLSRLTEDHLIVFVVRGFNGANRVIRIVEATGHIVANYKDEGGRDHGDELPTPTLVRNGPDPVNIDKFAEFHVTLHQHLAPSQAKAIALSLQGDGMSLVFDGLNIRASSINELGIYVRLPLWNGINLLPSLDCRSGAFST